MSVVKLMCPKTNEVVFKGKATVDVEVSYNVADDGTVTTELVSVSDVSADEIKNLSSSKGKIKMDTLIQGMQSDISGKWYNVEELVQAEIEDEENPGQTKTVIMSQAEFDAMSTPSIDEMNEEQAKELAKSQQEQLNQQADQIAQLMEQMKQMQAMMQQQMAAPQQAPVETNIQIPNQQAEDIVYADETPDDNNFEGFQGGETDEGMSQFEDVEAPF